MKTSDIARSVDLYELKPGHMIPVKLLAELLPNTEAALFFAKVYGFNYAKISNLLYQLFKTDVMEALMSGAHSTELQDFIVDICEEGNLVDAEPDFVATKPPAEVLPEVWKMAEVEIAKSIKEVAAKLSSTLHLMPSKQGKMVFKSMMQLNAQRPTLGVHKAAIAHEAVPDALVILDVSGSVSQPTVKAIIDEVVSMSYEANATLAIVSSNCFWWEPGTYNVPDVLAKAQYGGTQYETLAPLFKDRDWGTVVTIADYDSSMSSMRYLKNNCNSKVGTVLDISLVNRPSFLAECIAQFADKLQPLLIGQSCYPMR